MVGWKLRYSYVLTHRLGKTCVYIYISINIYIYRYIYRYTAYVYSYCNFDISNPSSEWIPEISQSTDEIWFQKATKLGFSKSNLKKQLETPTQILWLFEQEWQRFQQKSAFVFFQTSDEFWWLQSQKPQIESMESNTGVVLLQTQTIHFEGQIQ